jgi:hypothetical protein
LTYVEASEVSEAPSELISSIDKLDINLVNNEIHILLEVSLVSGQSLELFLGV